MEIREETKDWIDFNEIRCGDVFRAEDDDYYSHCEHCGCSCDRDEMHEIDGDYYCEDCCFWCEIHEEWEVRYSYRGEYLKQEVEINGEWYTMCGDAFDEEVVCCDKCGEYEWRDKAMVDDLNETLCRYCYEDFMNRKEEENEDEIA